MTRRTSIFVVSSLALALAACGGKSSATGGGDAIGGDPRQGNGGDTQGPSDLSPGGDARQSGDARPVGDATSGGDPLAGGDFAAPGDPSGPIPDPGQSSFVAEPTTLLADGNDASTLTVTVRDAVGSPIPGVTVGFGAASAVALVQPAGPTDADGVAVGYATANASGTRQVTAAVGSVTLGSVTLTFSCPAWLADCGDACADVLTDVAHCGACDTPCNLDSAIPRCAAGTCVIDACLSGRLDWDGLPANGCEKTCTKTSDTESCNGVDDNCDEQVDEGYSTQADVRYCGSACTPCGVGMPHARFACGAGGTCQFVGCAPGYWDINHDHTCSYGPCVFTSGFEVCNGVDDNCDGQIDEGVVPPSPSVACGVSPVAAAPECTSQVTVSCSGTGGWTCTFPAGVCTGGSCATTPDICDGLDNNCNGLVDENVVPPIGRPCASDDGLPPGTDGPCRGAGTYVCNGPSAAKCSAVKNMALATPEVADGIDNDCDGAIDETYNMPAAADGSFVKPVVTHVQTGPDLWIYTYEASRVSATGTTAGVGDGYFTAAPVGRTLDQTLPISMPGRLPWFDVTGVEAEQACMAVGGHLCTPADWIRACMAKTGSCTWGYDPAGAACTTGYVAGTKFCNLGTTYDFDPGTAGMQNGLLPTGSTTLVRCDADWSATLANTAGVDDQILDLTGNLRELTASGVNQYTLMGGSFLTDLEQGATCSFTFYTVDQIFALGDTGFRCCFTQDPRL